MYPALALAVALIAQAPIPPGTQLAYTGNLAPVKADQNPATKRFELKFVALGESDMAWVLVESGRGGWTWLDHFGSLAATRPALLYQRDDGRSVVNIDG